MHSLLQGWKGTRRHSLCHHGRRQARGLKRHGKGTSCKRKHRVDVELAREATDRSFTYSHFLSSETIIFRCLSPRSTVLCCSSPSKLTRPGASRRQGSSGEGEPERGRGKTREGVESWAPGKGSARAWKRSPSAAESGKGGQGTSSLSRGSALSLMTLEG